MANGAVYENDELQFIPHAEGYVTKNGNSYKYVYQYKDHLGNIRLSYSDSDGNGTIATSEIIEENNYYPFGLKHKGYNANVSANGNSVAQRYKYNGKEFDESLGINSYDFGARNYDPALGRWMNLDPLADQMRRHSPCNYAFDNPIYYIDPDGMAPFGLDNDIYLDRNGNEINRVVNDQPDRTFIVKTTKTTNNAPQTQLANTNPITRREARNTENQIENGNFEGTHMQNVVQIENADTQQEMLDQVNQDDGNGTVINIENGAITNPSDFSANNFREHGGNIENGQVTNPVSGDISIPSLSAKAQLDGNVDFHSHPSGRTTTKNADGTTTSGRTNQFPSSDDVSNARAGNTIKYQFGMTSRKVNIYNGSGVIAIIPFRNFGIR